MTSDRFEEGLEGLDQGAPRSGGRAAPGGGWGAHSDHPSVTALREKFGEAALRHEIVAGDEHIVYVDPEHVFDILSWLKDDPEQSYDFLQDLTAIDYGDGQRIQVVYQLYSIPHNRQLRIKADLPIADLELDSVYHLWRASDWLEREVYDMFGVVFRGHPDMRRILMPYNYAEGHPLRKDFPLRGRFTRAEQTRRALSMKTEDHYSPQELEWAKRLGQPLPNVMEEGGPGVPNPAMPGVGGA